MEKKKEKTADKNSRANDILIRGEDYYVNDKGQWVFTERYHLKRGSCCESGCKHCPYGYPKTPLA